jgi:putative lipoprotein
MQNARTIGAVFLAVIIGCQSGNMNDAPKDNPNTPAPGAGALGELHVDVFYRERMLLPPTAELKVTFEDGAKMDVAAEKIAEATVPIQGAPPYRVTLSYDPSKLDTRGRYGVRARIENEGQLMFTSTQMNPAFGVDGSKDGAPNDPVKVLVSRVAAARKTNAPPLVDTRWVLVKLRGEDATSGAGGKAPSVTLTAEGQRISGFAGCNQMTGGYQLDGDRLSFSKIAMTMRACPEGMDLERELGKALEETRSYEISTDALRIHSEDGTIVAEFKAD